MPGILKKLKAKRKAKKVAKYVQDRKENPTVVNKPKGGKPGPGYMGYSKGGKMKYKDGGLTQYD